VRIISFLFKPEVSFTEEKRFDLDTGFETLKHVLLVNRKIHVFSTLRTYVIGLNLDSLNSKLKTSQIGLQVSAHTKKLFTGNVNIYIFAVKP
jgi:hypothetical protein